MDLIQKPSSYEWFTLMEHLWLHSEM